MYQIQFVFILVSVILLLVIFNFIRMQRLKIRYALLWIITCLMMITFSVWRRLIDDIAQAMGIYYPPSVLFIFAFLFLLAIVFHFSIVISNLAEQNKKLAEEVALLRQKIEEMEKKK